MNIIVLPPYYEGTSFEEIAKAFTIATKSIPDNFEFISYKVLENNLEHNSLDDDRFIYGQLGILREVTNIIVKDEPLNLLFMDAFNPGLDLVKYFHEKHSIDVKYAALVHGGTYLSDDLYDFPWLRHYEEAWFSTYDILYVSSDYSYSRLPDNYKKKARVFPWGMDAFTPIVSKKDIDVIFPHRLDRDKGADFLLDVADAMPNIHFAITIPSKNAVAGNHYYDRAITCKNVSVIVGESNDQHVRTLGRAKIVFSNSRQELYGYSIMKSVLSNCLPVLPKDQCYPDFFPEKYMYTSIDGACELIQKYMENYQDEIYSSEFKTLKEKVNMHSFKDLLQDFIK